MNYFLNELNFRSNLNPENSKEKVPKRPRLLGEISWEKVPERKFLGEHYS
jgi:hypothetical protein